MTTNIFDRDRTRRLGTTGIFPGDDPVPSWELDVADYLYWRGYHAESIRTILDVARAKGSVECCDPLRFDARDRSIVEQLLPDAPAAEWEAHAGNWEMTGVSP
jgi:hypothetical protein